MSARGTSLAALASTERQGGPLSPLRRSDTIAGYLMVSPAVLLFGLFILGPVAAALILSTFSWDLLGKARFVGLANFPAILSDPKAIRSLVNTTFFTFFGVVLHVVVGLALAMAANRAMNGALRHLLRTAFFFPVLVSWAAASLIWKYILDPNFGFVTYYLTQAGIAKINWFISPTLALPMVVFIDLWKTVGFIFIVMLAGLQGIPHNILEAATVDGATGWRRFWHVTLPLLSPTLLFAITLTFILDFLIFDPIFVLTPDGGPMGSTRTIVFYIYETAFRSFDMGYAAALSLVVFVIVLVATVVQLRFSRRWVHYE